MIARERVCEVYAPCGPDKWECGSGTLVARGLVLTAAHVVGPLGTPAQIRLLDDGRLLSCEVAWSRSSAEVDAALLRITDEDVVEPDGLPPVRWGQLVCTRAGAGCEALGFPQVKAGPDRVRDSEQLAGTLRPLGSVKTGRLDVAVSGAPDTITSTGVSPWQGMSGAGLFCNGVLVGVVARDERGFASTRVGAVRASSFVGDPDFQALVWPGGSRPGLEPAELARLQQPGGQVASAASLLRADVAAVEFHGRDAELRSLDEWCAGTGVSARLMTGQGGQGKTRLAHEFAARRRRQGWATVLVAERTDPDAFAWLGSVCVPLLAVVDYAEQRTGQLANLGAALADRSQSTPIRILLLARADGEWRSQLPPELEFIALGAVVHPLSVLDPEPTTKSTAFERAASDFASRLADVPGHSHVDWHAIAETAPVPALGADTTALGVQMGALVALLQAAAPVFTVDTDTAADIINRHEARYWSALAAQRGLNLAAPTQRLAVTAACLLPATDADEASALLARVPGLDETDSNRRIAVASWLRELYPQPPAWWGGLQPDVLAESLVATTLGEHPALLSGLLASVRHEQAAHAMTVLSRAAGRYAHVAAQLRTVVVGHPERLAPIAVAVALEAASPQPLTDALSDLAISHDVPLLIKVSDQIPQSTQVHAELAAALAVRIVECLRSETENGRPDNRAVVATWLSNLSVRLSHLGRSEEGLAAIEEAAAIRRELATSRPDAFLPDLAMSLNNLSIPLGDLGRHEEGLAAIEEAVDAHRQLATSHPDTFLPDLASSLNNLSIRLGDLGRHEEGLAAIEEAAAIRRQLATSHPDAFLPDLAMSLNNLSIQLGDLGRRHEALATIQEAVDVYRQLAATCPDAFLPDLAMSLNNLSNRLGDLGRHEESLATIQEAAANRRQLATSHPDAFLPDLAMSLNNLANRLGDLGDHEVALATIQEAVAAYRDLAGVRPDAFLPDLASSLNNLSIRLGGVDRREEGLAAIEEAVDVYRQLAATRPDAFLPRLATSLNNRSVRLGQLGRHEEGLAAIEEAVAIRRELASTRPDAFLPDLASSLNNLSVRLSDLGRREEGLAAIHEAVDVYRQLAGARPDVFLPRLATSLHTLCHRLSDLGRHAEAEQADHEARTVTT
jgi:tetratricopeptide (TPR) repeat protein